MAYTIRFLNNARTDLLGTATGERGFNALAQAPTPETISGKKFKYWANFGGVDLTGDLSAVYEDMTVVPFYEDVAEETTYKIRFLNYARTDLLKSVIIREGGNALEEAPTPEDFTSQGMIFKYWANYQGHDKTADLMNVQKDMTVVPFYEIKIQYTVRFMNYAGTAARSIQTLEPGEDAIPPAPEKIDKRMFLGWDKKYTDIQANVDIHPVYSIIPDKSIMYVYEKNDDGTSGRQIATFRAVNACTISEKLTGECTISVKIVSKQTNGIITLDNRVEISGLVFDITEIKKSVSSGIVYTEFTGEHVSYLLNDDKYKVESVLITGTPKEVLMRLLADTPFTVGEVEPTQAITLRVNTEATRRACLMQVIAMVGCEIDYYGYSISVVRHRGSSQQKDIMSAAQVQDISVTQSRTEDINNYSISLFKKGDFELGDELSLRFLPMEISDVQRIVGIDWNPFNFRECSITIGTYIPTLNDSLYSLVETVENITDSTAKYTVEFGELIGNGSFYFTRSYNDKPLFLISTNDGSEGHVTLNKKNTSEFAPYVGATLSGVNSNTETLLVFYCTLPVEKEDSDV